MELCTYKVNITGTVQGVGFRPFIYALAQRYRLTGTVSNNAKGVEIRLNADPLGFKQFLTAIESEAPSLASIDTIRDEKLPFQSFDDFQIIQSKEEGEINVNIPPDVSICRACEEELFDSNNRRYGYPFITCAHCGVRYSIIYDLPYDRGNTSMKFFEMCKACSEEYNNPLNRRYHAQPIGCWDCGTSLELVGRVALIPTITIGRSIDVNNLSSSSSISPHSLAISISLTITANGFVGLLFLSRNFKTASSLVASHTRW